MHSICDVIASTIDPMQLRHKIADGIFAKRLVISVRQPIVKCSHEFNHTMSLNAWGQFLQSRPQSTGMRFGSACTRVGTAVKPWMTKWNILK